MKAAAKEAGFTAEFKAVAWDGIFAGLASGKYNAICSSVSITDERKKTMGVASAVPRPGQDPTALLRLADYKLYEAKLAGRNRILTGTAL